MLLYPDITKINPDDVNNYQTVAFEGEIVLVETAEDADAACNYLKQFAILGFDTETKPNFKKGRKNKVALLQLSTHEKAFLFRINKIGIPQPIIQIFSNSAIFKIGAATKDDINTLRHIAHFEPQGVIDIQTIVRNLGIEQLGLKNIAALILGIKISKSQQLSNWENEILTLPQQQYAATDAWVCLEIYKTIKAKGYLENPPVIIKPAIDLEQNNNTIN